MALISAPTIIMSVDNSVDTSIFFGLNEEEEKEGVKLLFEITSLELENLFLDIENTEVDAYTFGNYPKPHLNLISPPPEIIA